MLASLAHYYEREETRILHACQSSFVSIHMHSHSINSKTIRTGCVENELD